MRNPLTRVLVGLAALAAVVVLFVVLAGGDDNGDGGDQATTTQTQLASGATVTTGQGQANPEPKKAATPRIVVVGGKPRGGVKRLSYKTGDRIQFTVTSDVADEVHVHGYDMSKDVPAGGTVRFSFPARIEGVFEAELEGRKQQIAELRVSPG
jgi:hypothetical protein